MQRSLYLRPIGLHAARRNDEAIEVRGALPLAHGIFDFTGFEVIERTREGVKRRIVGLADLADMEWGRRIEQSLDIYDALLGMRPQLGRLGLDRPRIMGIVNVTPDSFSDGGQHASTAAAIEHGLRLAAEGADILDIGGESTRPGSDGVPLEEELRRVIPVIEGLAGKTDALISIDTRKAEVMRRAAAAGAGLINDVSALSLDPGALDAAAETGLPVVLMHAQGDPKTMQEAPSYNDVLLDVYDYLEARIGAANAAGIPSNRIIVDPGIGFGKTVDHNLALIAGLSLFHTLGVPVMLGASRKRFIGTLTGDTLAADRVNGSVGSALAGTAQGAQMLRVHDVKAHRQALDVWLAATRGSSTFEMQP